MRRLARRQLYSIQVGEACALLAAPFLVMAILFPGAAHSAGMNVEGGWGKCRASPPDEGTWNQREHPHRMQLTDQCGEFGLRWNFEKDTSLGIRWVNFGQFASQAVANNDPQDKADLRGTISTDHERPACQQIGPSGPARPLTEDCHYRWNGSGHLYGALINASVQPFKLGDFKIGPEAGVVLYRASWRVVIQPTQSNAWQYQYDQRTGINIAPALGIRADWKWVYAAARWYWIPDGAPITPAYRSPIRQFVVGVSIPLPL